jgi:hypothetical protein
MPCVFKEFSGRVLYVTKQKSLMKIRLLLLPFLFLLASCANEIKLDTSDVPSQVINAFNAKYPEAQDVKWVAEEDDGFYFGAKFKLNNAEKVAHYKTDGTFVEEEAGK